MQRGLSGGRFGFVQCALAALVSCHLCIAFTCWIVVPSMLGCLQCLLEAPQELHSLAAVGWLPSKCEVLLSAAADVCDRTEPEN